MMPAAAQAAMVGIMPALKRNTASIAATVRTSAGTFRLLNAWCELS